MSSLIDNKKSSQQETYTFIDICGNKVIYNYNPYEPDVPVLIRYYSAICKHCNLRSAYSKIKYHKFSICFSCYTNIRNCVISRQKKIHITKEVLLQGKRALKNKYSKDIDLKTKREKWNAIPIYMWVDAINMLY